MSEIKTVPTKANVSSYIENVGNEQVKKDSKVIQKIMFKVTRKRAKIWGSSIIGFGQYQYKYNSGRIGIWPIVGFSPKKTNLTIYIMSGFEDYKKELKQLGKFKLGKSCLYIKKLEDVDLDILEKIISESVNTMKERYNCS